MLDDHNEVNKAKELLLHWLISFGRDEVSLNQIVQSGVASINIWWYMDKGLIYENDKAPTYRYALTDKALDFLNKGEKNEQ